jgi:hypothetical protein
MELCNRGLASFVLFKVTDQPNDGCERAPDAVLVLRELLRRQEALIMSINEMV